MKIIFYPPWRKQFYFCFEGATDEVLTSVYQPLHPFTKLTWAIWKRSKAIRSLCNTKEDALPIPLDFLKNEFNNFDNSLWVINKGTMTPDQKQSAIFIDLVSEEKYFIKFAGSDLAKQSLNKEISVLERLSDSGLTPKLYKKGSYKSSSYFISELVIGKKPRSFKINNHVLQLLIQINSAHWYVDSSTNLLFSFNHGDFCPWNLIITEKKLVAIDWERAGNGVLGYDLFTYIFYTQFLLFTSKPIVLIMKQNLKWIDEYFQHYNITDWRPYLIFFAKSKIKIPNSASMKNKLEKLIKISSTSLN